MAMQVVNPQKPEHMRAFNPDRDMIWAMPRLMGRVFHALGDDWSVETFWRLQHKYGIDAVGERGSADVMERTIEVVKGFAKMFNLMQQVPEKTEEHAAEYKRLKELCPGFHLTISAMLMDVIMSELPAWFDQVRPKSKMSPTPDIEKIEEAASDFISRSSKG